MHLRFWAASLPLKHRWTIARGTTTIERVVFVEVREPGGTIGLGEAAPCPRYSENIETVRAFLERIDPARLSFEDIPGAMAYLETLGPGNAAAKGAVNIALWDGAARKAGKPMHDALGLGFREGAHPTSFSIGIDTPDAIRAKVLAAAEFPILKLKVGVPGDRENLAALREAAPGKKIRVDANEAWSDKKQALAMLEWLAADGNIEFCEQPMPARSDWNDLKWLKERTPLPIMADESYLTAADLPRCADLFHAVNVKLAKAGGISAAFEALAAARGAGLKTMLGCMIESSVLITAAAHLAELTDYLDLDGNLLIEHDPYAGVTAAQGMISFKHAPEAAGLRVAKRM